MPDFHNYILSKTQHWYLNLTRDQFVLGYSHTFFDLALKAEGYKEHDWRMK